MSEPPPKLETPKVPEVSIKTSSGTGEPVEDFATRKKTFPSAGKFENESRVTLKKASNRLEPNCSEITAFVVSNAAVEIE
jgi:hypothetical protein